MVIARTTEMPRVIKGNGVGGGYRPVRRFGLDRTCEAAGCVTRLSVYNPAPVCWVHEEPHEVVMRADRTTIDEGPVLREDFAMLFKAAAS